MFRNLTSVALVMIILVACNQTDAESKDTHSSVEADSILGETNAMTSDYKTIPLEMINGDSTTLSNYQGKVLLLVNVASECGFTKQYSGLEKLYRKFADSGLVIIGFPANNFGKQEPGSNEQILEFCQNKYDVTFPMMAKVSVKGKDKHPLFTYLTENSGITGEIEWNFSKFLLDREGNLVARFKSEVEPMSDQLLADIRKQL